MGGLDNLSRFYSSRFQEGCLLFDDGKVEEALDVWFDMRLQPDINLIHRSLVNLGIGMCLSSPRVPDPQIYIRESFDLCQEAAIMWPDQDFSDIEAQIFEAKKDQEDAQVKATWFGQKPTLAAPSTGHAEGSPVVSPAVTPDDAIEPTRIEGLFKYNAGHRDIFRKNFDVEYAKFKIDRDEKAKGEAQAELGGSFTTAAATSFAASSFERRDDSGSATNPGSSDTGMSDHNVGGNGDHV